MRPFALVSVVVAHAAALALSMVLVNIAFEAAGSVPDLDGCGFLAGSLAVLAFLYPLLAGVFGARLSRRLLDKVRDADVIARSGAAVGALGSGFYFGLGGISVMRSPHGAAVSPNLWALATVFVLVCAWAGKIGTSARPAGTLAFLLRRTGN